MGGSFAGPTNTQIINNSELAKLELTMQTAMITESHIEQTVKNLFAGLEFTREPKGLYDPLRYMIEIGGKRIRPHLCLLTYSLYKDGGFDESILQPAAALEVFHSFTLIHDDIMDKADIRRGVPTVYRKWDENTAILSGDVMSIDSYKRIAKAPAEVLPEALELFSTTAAQVCDGQQYDMDFEDKEIVPMEEYLKMIGLKTAVLIAFSAKLGALIAGAEKEDCDHLYRFGYDLGLAFQITDDWLDTFGDEKVFGKAIGGDILNNKKTWLMIKALEKAASESEGSPYGLHPLLDAMKMPTGTDAQKTAKIICVKNIYKALKVDEDAQEEISRLHGQALAYASRLDLPEEEYIKLYNYAARLIGRNK